MPHADDNVFFDHLSPFGVAPYAMGIAANMVSPGGNVSHAMEGNPLVHEICRVARVNSPVTAAVPDRQRWPWSGVTRGRSDNFGKFSRSRTALSAHPVERFGDRLRSAKR